MTQMQARRHNAIADVDTWGGLEKGLSSPLGVHLIAFDMVPLAMLPSRGL